MTLEEKYPEFIKDDITTNILDCLLTTRSNMFITGPAGCGKSTLLKIIQDKDIYPKEVVTICPTGISAVNVNGVTIHSFFKFPPALINEDECMRSLRTHDEIECDVEECDCQQVQLLNRIDTFIIDEVSMVNPNMFDSIDLYLRSHLDSDIPFANKRIILFGDLYQLPPVVKKGSSEYKILSERYNDTCFYFFTSDVYKNSKFEHFVMEKVHRQSDQKFVDILHRIRKGNHTVSDIKEINKFVIDEGDYMDSHEQYIYISYTNAVADNINKMYLEMIPLESKTYYATCFGKGKLRAKDFTAPEELELKVGAQVLVCANSTAGLYNGMLGEVTELHDDFIYITDKNKRIWKVERYTWVCFEYKLQGSKIERKEVGKFIQYPLKLAFALNAHKCQGLTLDNIYLDVGTGSFTTGQFYVALSRLRTFEGLGLKKAINMFEVKVDDSINTYFKEIEKLTIKEKECI